MTDQTDTLTTEAMPESGPFADDIIALLREYEACDAPFDVKLGFQQACRAIRAMLAERRGAV